MVGRDGQVGDASPTTPPLNRTDDAVVIYARSSMLNNTLSNPASTTRSRRQGRRPSPYSNELHGRFEQSDKDALDVDFPDTDFDEDLIIGNFDIPEVVVTTTPVVRTGGVLRLDPQGHALRSQSKHPDDPDEQEYCPPKFKIRNPDQEAIEGNWEWERESVSCDDVLTVAADYLGPVTSADILARHWFNMERPGDIVAMAEHLLALHRRLTRSCLPANAP